MKIANIITAIACAALCACDDLHDYPSAPQSGEPLLVLCEGLFNMNNSTLAYTGSNADADIFLTANARRLGDTANDMILYGGKIYIVVNVSSTVEVIDSESGRCLRQLRMFDSNERARQPRYAVGYGGNVYVCCFDGTVQRIDTASLAITGESRAGRHPDGICAAGGKIFVSNSGGLDAPNYATTVSAIDTATLAELTQIEVGINPGCMAADTDGNVYVAVRGNWEDAEPHIAVIDSRTCTVTKRIDVEAARFVAFGNQIWGYCYAHQSGASSYFVIENQQAYAWLPAEPTPQCPYAIAVSDDRVLIADAKNYTERGDIYTYDKLGNALPIIRSVGLNPNTIIPIAMHATTTGEGDADDNLPSAVVEYCPAPGQFINTPTSCYAEGVTYTEMLTTAQNQIRNGELITLGGFGGYITVRFDTPIANLNGPDLRISGNAFSTPSGCSAEPGIVCVSADDNGNGLPDDKWYELEGSEHYAASTIRNYQITYVRKPSGTEWFDNQNNEGTLTTNSFHPQHYYPLWIQADTLRFAGTRLPDVAHYDEASHTWIFTPFAWGYADNSPNGSAGTEFDLSNAIDSRGQKANITEAHFVRIYTAVRQECGHLGEVSTEISKIERLH